MGRAIVGKACAWIGAVATTFCLACCAGAEAQDVLGSPSPSGASNGADDDDGGGGGPVDAAVTTDAGPPIGTTCTEEEEDNGSAESANVLDPTLCGAISDADDVDVLTFELDKRTKRFSLEVEGDVTATVSVGDESTMLDGSGPVLLPIVRGEPYFVEVHANDGAALPAPWKITRVEKP